MRATPATQRGFTYVGLLMAVVIMGLVLTVTSRVWSTSEQRERERQLLYVGHAYRMAIASYYASGHHFPAALQDLLVDDRSPLPMHHLRRLYPDPMTGAPDWTLILTPSGTGIMGVASSSQRGPIKRDGFELIDSAFKDADCYCSWQFIYYANRFNRPVPIGAVTSSASATTGSATTNSAGDLNSHAPTNGSAPGSIDAAPGTSSWNSDAGSN